MKILHVILVVLLCFSCKNTNTLSNSSLSTYKSYYDKKLKKNIYLTYDFPAEYKKGEREFMRDVLSNIELKNINRYDNYKVVFRLIIDENGNVLDIIIVDKNDQKKNKKDWSSTEREVVNALSKMTKDKWSPAKCGNIPVTSSLFLFIRLNIRFKPEQ